MTIEAIRGRFSVCKLSDAEGVLPGGEFTFFARTDGELSLVCRSEAVPENTLSRADGWRTFRVQGTLDFSLVGILADISRVLAEEKIGIFAVSTYDTDYILTAEADFGRALTALGNAGYEIKDT